MDKLPRRLPNIPQRFLGHSAPSQLPSQSEPPAYVINTQPPRLPSQSETGYASVMDTQPPPRLPKIKFRVLIIGRANAGKTSILQRVCDTTESPVVYRQKGFNKERVRCLGFVDSASLVSLPYQIQLDPSMEVSDRVPFVGYYLPLSQRGDHRIEDEIVFSNHEGYIFHDSRGFESGGADELKIVQNFVQQKSGENRLANRLHAIWFELPRFKFTITITDGHGIRYCIPMDNVRPELDLKHFKDICPDPNGVSV